MRDTINGTTGVTTGYQYDALNRNTSLTQGNKRVDYSYNPIGQVTNKKRYSDATGTNLVAETNHSYDVTDRLANINHSKGTNPIGNYTQTYDRDSRITGIASKDGTSTYTYDNTDQLTGANYSFQTNEGYTYDELKLRFANVTGNRTNTGYVTGKNNRLLEDATDRLGGTEFSNLYSGTI